MTLADPAYVGSGVLGNVRGLPSSLGDPASQSPNGHPVRLPEALEVKVGASCTTAEYESARVRSASRVRAWMVVPPMDVVLIVAPLAWRPHQIYAVVAMAVLSTILLSGGVR